MQSRADAFPCRWMGDARFTVGALQQILWRRSHRLRLAYLPTNRDAVQAAVQVLLGSLSAVCMS